MRPLLLCLTAALVAGTPRARLAPTTQDGTQTGDDVRTHLPTAAFAKAPVRLVYDHVTQRTTLEGPDEETLEA